MSTKAAAIVLTPAPPRDFWDRFLIATIFAGMLAPTPR
jgi:hypothetical protein